MKQVLVIEDSRATRSLIISVLDAIGGIQPIEASSGFEALRILPTEHFDLILTDINMPDINGLEVVSFLKTTDRYSHIPVIIITTEGSERDRNRGLDLGAERYITKPFEADELRSAIEDILRSERGTNESSHVL